MKLQLKLLACGLALSLSGCVGIGPKVAKQAQYPYNEAFSYTANEQLLLNVVRMRYRDNPYFLKVTSVTASHALKMSLGAELNFPKWGSANSTPAIKPGLEYADQPVIAYQPLEGEAYVKQLLRPIPLLRMIDLIESGWSIERVLDICVQKVNRIENAPSASGPTPDYVPEYEEFARLASNLRILQKANLVNFGKDPGYDITAVANLLDPGPDVLMYIERDERFAPVIDEVYGMLNVKADTRNIRFSGNYIAPYTEGVVKLKTRTLLGALFYVSQAVEVPEEHEIEGLVTTTCYKDGSRFEWDDVSGRELKIYSSKCNPKFASIKVYYRGYWFYVADNDLNSKTSFMLLSKLFNLQYVSEGYGSVTPQLMIPLKD